LAQTVPPVLDACSAEPDASKRLACFDREIARLHELAQTQTQTQTPTPGSGSARVPKPGVPAPATPSAAPPVDSTPSPPEERFGMTEALQHKSGTQSKQLDNLKGRVVAVTYKGPEQVRLTLENDQVWEQTEPEAHLGLAPGDTVTIHRGLLGAFYLSSDKVHGLRVQRLQ
jgi:hypothetical protein